MQKSIITHAVKATVITVMCCPLYAGAQLYQQPEEKRTITIAANTQYDKASKFKRIMLGQHYRREWATAVDIEILDMDAEAGGLTPLKLGGGLQTRSLRLKGGDGKEYVLRSVNKDPSKAIVEELRGTFAEDIVQDQISSANPYAPLVVASLAKAAGIFHSTPKMVYVPASARLGEYATGFAGTVCLLEERPAGNEENNAAYGYSKKVVNSQKLLEKVFSNSDHQVNEKAFLKARLFDILIGDWDRHEDQWLWAAFEKNDQTFYQPIPRDRDQAFSKMDGLIPGLTTRKWAIRKIQHFDESIRDINGLNTNGMHLDRNFTTRLSLADWIEVAEELQDAITDQAITNAFLNMPDPIYNIDGKKTAAILKKRRDSLHKYAISYYQFLSQQVNITGTKEKEIFEVHRISDDETKVVVYKTGKNEEREGIIYKRTFFRAETKEIRLYGLNGNDVFNIEGEVKKGILVRIIGGKGTDTVADQSVVKGLTHHTRIYDNKENVINPGKESKQLISNDSLKNDYNRKSFRFDWLAPTLNPGFNPDDGFYVGGGVTYKKQQFGKTPFGYMQSISGNYAFNTGAWSVWYKGIFKEFIGKADLHLTASYHSPSYSRNYYGLGNETTQSEEVDKKYYWLRMSQLSLSSSFHRKLSEHHSLHIGNGFQAIRISKTENRFVATDAAKIDSADFDRKKYIRTQVGYEFNTIDNPLYPKKGIKLLVNTAYVQNITDRDQHFVQVSSEINFYNSIGRFTLASRTGVSANLNDKYEFFQANTLGGLNNLRGYHRDRYAGKTSLYFNNEVRFSISDVNAYVVKGSWGLLGFVDNGRVWMPDENSEQWHWGYGGGIWFLPFNKLALTTTYGISKEDKLISIKAEFLF